MRRRILSLVALAFAGAALAAAPAPGQSKGKPSRAEAQAKLKQLFPGGHREGTEGVMKLGVQFRTVAMRNWQQCREFCLKNPAVVGESGCLLWTFTKAPEPRMPSTCRMWWDLPEVRANPDAVSGAGRLK
jgi:hypothetical protein